MSELIPDDVEINEAIDTASTFYEAMFEIAEKYGANVTNNEERWQDGVYLRHIGEFTQDVRVTAERFHIGARAFSNEQGKAAFLAFMGMDEQSFLEMSPRYRAGSIAQGIAALEAAHEARSSGPGGP